MREECKLTSLYYPCPSTFNFFYHFVNSDSRLSPPIYFCPFYFISSRFNSIHKSNHCNPVKFLIRKPD